MSSPSRDLERRLRAKFAKVAMASVALVLVALLAAINIANYLSVCSRADERVDLIMASGGSSGLVSDDAADAAAETAGAGEGAGVLQRFDSPRDRTAARVLPDPGRMSVEAPFETRFFSVEIADSGEVAGVDIERIAAVDEEGAVELAREVAEGGEERGFHGAYRFGIERGDGVATYTFVDCTRELSSFREFLAASITVGAVGLVLVLVLVLAFSRAAIQPIVESYEKQRRFITDASHEMKTPVAVIGAANDVVEIELGESEWTHSIREQVNRLSELTERLVALARMDEGGLALDVERVDVSGVVERAAEPFGPIARSRGKSLRLDIAPHVSARGDASAIAQVVELLLDNATRYASEGGAIELSVASHRGGALITCANDVDEVPEGNLDQLFERFFRGDAARAASMGGTGVGLAMVRAIAEAHGGTACVAEQGGRLVFTVRL